MEWVRYLKPGAKRSLQALVTSRQGLGTSPPRWRVHRGRSAILLSLGIGLALSGCSGTQTSDGFLYAGEAPGYYSDWGYGGQRWGHWDSWRDRGTDWHGHGDHDGHEGGRGGGGRR